MSAKKGRSRKTRPRIVPEIKWNDVVVPKPKMGDTLEYETQPLHRLPYVTLFTVVKSRIGFYFALLSWKITVYPAHLLRWVIIDFDGHIDQSNDPSADDPRISVCRMKADSYHKMIAQGLAYAQKNFKHEGTEEIENHRERCFGTLACDEVCAPDHLIAKYSLMKHYKKVACIPSGLGYYELSSFVSRVYKAPLYFPEGDLFWMSNWWTARSSVRAVGTPYVINGIHIGACQLPCVQICPSQFRFYDSLPDGAHKLIRYIMAQERGGPSSEPKDVSEPSESSESSGSK